jgi:biopolymer transport protein TolQ
MTQDFSIVHLLLNASWVVQVVVLMLMTVSIVSWAAIFRKIGSIKRIKELNDEFERDFWSGTSLNELFAAAAQNAKTSGPMERIFASGMREYQKLRERRINDSSALMDGARRAMRASYQREMDAIESNLSMLASVVWHGLGHHARLHGLGGYAASDLGQSGPRYCRSLGGYRHWFVCCDSCSVGLQPFLT